LSNILFERDVLPMTRIEISAESAASVKLEAGQVCRIVNTEGGQVVDTWAFSLDDLDEYLSMEHSRSANYKLLFEPGDQLFTNHFQPILLLREDTSPGYHDTLHAACSAGSNRFYESSREYPNCQNNLMKQMGALGKPMVHVPCPWNLFEHALVEEGLKLVDEVSATAPGEYIELEALMDIVLVCSACPSLVGQISGEKPRAAAIDLLTD
jgi:uncharacterized protein YcgI (DUF1989 family)